jgi:hypothetical protein
MRNTELKSFIENAYEDIDTKNVYFIEIIYKSNLICFQ